MAEGLLGRLGGRGHSPAKKFPVAMSEEEWRGELPPPGFRVVRHRGTRRAGPCTLAKEYGEGVYRCAGCGQPLFASDAKFDSGTGWPSFGRRSSKQSRRKPTAAFS